MCVCMCRCAYALYFNAIRYLCVRTLAFLPSPGRLDEGATRHGMLFVRCPQRSRQVQAREGNPGAQPPHQVLHQDALHGSRNERVRPYLSSPAPREGGSKDLRDVSSVSRRDRGALAFTFFLGNVGVLFVV